MKSAAATRLAAFVVASLAAAASAHAAGAPSIERLATCQESWLDWKDDTARGKQFADALHANYDEKDEGWLAPKKPQTLFGLPVARLYPDSVGMGVGFSVLVDGGFEATKKTIEKAVGKTLKCDKDSDEMLACQFELGPQKTLTVASDSAGSKTTLVGCFYFYEK